MVSMKYGPVLSAVYDLIKDKRTLQNYWTHHIGKRGTTVFLKSESGRDELSRYEIDLLERVHREYETLDDWGLQKLTHALPEYKKTERSIPIKPETILKTSRKISDDDIEEIRNDTEELRFFAELGR
jgi:uncharacterized phage-associated protein